MPSHESVTQKRIDKRSEKPHKNTRERVKFGGPMEFISNKLNKEELAEFDSWFVDHELDITTYVTVLLQAGYRISVIDDEYTGACQAQLSPRYTDMRNVGRMLCAFGEDYTEAVALLVYKHQVLFAGGDWELRDEPHAARG